MEDVFQSLVHGSERYLQIYAERGNNLDLQNTDGETLLISAIKQRMQSQIMQLVHLGCNVNKRGNDGFSPLAWSVTTKQFDIFSFLLNNGALMDASDKDGDLLFQAALTCDLSILDCVIKNGLPIDKLDSKGRLLLIEFVMLQNIGCVKFLLENGADVNAQSVKGRTPLIEAVWKKDKYMIDLLVLNGAEINMEDGLNRTALCESAKINRLDLVSYFLDKGADVNLIGMNNKVALSYGVISENVAMIDNLLDHGADCYLKDVSSESPLCIALKRGGKSKLAIAEKIITHPKCKANIDSYLYIHNCTYRQRVPVPSDKAFALLLRHKANPFKLLQEHEMTAFESLVINVIAKSGNSFDETEFPKCPKWLYLLRNCGEVTLPLKLNPVLKLLSCRSFKLFFRMFYNEDEELTHADQFIYDNMKPIHMRRFGNNILNMAVQVIKLGAVISNYSAMWQCYEEKCICYELRHKLVLDLDDLLDEKLNCHRIDRKPVSLRLQCRTAIRSCLSDNCVEKVKRLPLPSMIKQFMCFEGEF